MQSLTYLNVAPRTTSSLTSLEYNISLDIKNTNASSQHVELALSVDKVVSCNCFRSGHAQDSCAFPLAIIIKESPKKLLQAVHSWRDVDRLEGVVASNVDWLEGVVAFVETAEESCVQDVDAGIVEIDDEGLNQAYDELLTQEFNPDAEDFKDDTEDFPVTGEFYSLYLNSFSSVLFFNFICFAWLVNYVSLYCISNQKLKALIPNKGKKKVQFQDLDKTEVKNALAGGQRRVSMPRFGPSMP